MNVTWVDKVRFGTLGEEQVNSGPRSQRALYIGHGVTVCVVAGWVFGILVVGRLESFQLHSSFRLKSPMA